ncbi:hypothetical protein C8Q73DRAFT_677972, partial [Cubamyces lactineus]
MVGAAWVSYPGSRGVAGARSTRYVNVYASEPRRSGSKLTPHSRLNVEPQRQRSRLVSNRPDRAPIPSAGTSAPPAGSSALPARSFATPTGLSALLPSVLSDNLPPSSDVQYPLYHSFNIASLPALVADESAPLFDSVAAEDRELIEDYWFALHAIGGIFRIEDAHYVLQDWDSKAKCLQIGVYRHLIRLPHGPGESGTVCTCPQWKARNTCLHLSTSLSYRHVLSTLRLIAPSPIPPAVFLCTTAFCEVHVFSCVSATSQYESGKRVIVVLRRDGRWHCESCRYTDSCKHKPHARALAANIGLAIESGDPTSALHGDDQTGADTEGAVLLAAGTWNDGGHSCVSHMKILPPRWCALPSENIPTPSVLTSDVDHLSLDALSRCACGTPIQAIPGWEAQAPTTQRAILFGSRSRRGVTIDVVPCPTCHHRRRFIGPDLGVLAILNLNNEYLFTHELLNGYTNAFTASETPFSAFCLMLRRSYEEAGPEAKFCADETFVRAWFAFVKLQELDSGFKCPTCGPAPSVVIADGVSLAPHASKLTPLVMPPTHTNASSERIESISSYRARKLPAIHQKAIRKEIHTLLDMSTQEPQTLQDSDLSDDIRTLYPEIVVFLRTTLHADMYSVKMRHRRKAYRDLMRQIASPDIVLQLVPSQAINALIQFAETGVAADWLQAYCPAIGTILKVHSAEASAIPDTVRDVARWLGSCAQNVFSRLAQHSPATPTATTVHPPGPPLASSRSTHSWIETGTCYGLPAIRSRRVYPKLRHDGATTDRDAEELGECNKFYKTYSTNQLAGGILVLWC